MIKYDVQKLQEELDKSTKDYKYVIKHFFNDENILAKLDTNQFFLLYLLWGKETQYNPADLSTFLLASEIDPLPSMNNIINEMFKGCLIKEVALDHFEYIGSQAFWNNELTNIYVGDKTQQIYSQAFGGNLFLKSVSLPKHIYLGSNIFDGCNHLKEITYRGTKEDWNAMSGAFNDDWDAGSSIETIQCSDGVIDLTDIYD